MSAPAHFAHPERGPYELGRLLRSLPTHLHAADLTAAQADMAEAAAIHASNCKDTLLSGLESLGCVIWSAAQNKVQSVDLVDFANVGMLVTQLAVQLQFLTEFCAEADESAMRAAMKGQSK